MNRNATRQNWYEITNDGIGTVRDKKNLNQTFQIILEWFIANGQAPNHLEIAFKLGVSPKKGRKILRKLFSSIGFPGWFLPKTDEIASFAPFSNIPNNYKLTIDGEQKWFGQWAFESLAVCWLFPGKTVQIDSRCPDCDKPISVRVKDGKIISTEPMGVIGHVSVPFGKWVLNMPYSWSTMNFFRSEEHLQNWGQFQNSEKQGIISLSDLMCLFSGQYFTNRRQWNYYSLMGYYTSDLVISLSGLQNAGSYWRLKWYEKIGFALALKLGII